MRVRSFYLDRGCGGCEWLASFGPVFTSDELAIPGTSGGQTIWAGGNFVLSHSICERADLVARPYLLGGRAFDHLAICLVVDGAIEAEFGGGSVVVTAGDLMLLDLREPMRLVFGTQGMTSVFTLWVSRAQLPAQFGGHQTLHGLVGKADVPGITVARAALRALFFQLDAVTAEELDELAAGIVALIGHAISSFATFISRASQSIQPAPLESLVTLCRYVEDNLSARDLGAAKLATTFGLSRASLYRLFAPVGGVASFIRERRLARARRELAMPGLQNRRIGPIAYQAGFHSIAAFNRAFRAAYGQTPRDVRKPVSGLAPVVKPPGEMGVLARWLLETAA